MPALLRLLQRVALCSLLAIPTLQAAPAIEPLLASAELRGHLALVFIRAHHAYQAGLSGQGVRIAIIDSGVDPLHPDIAPNLLPQSIDIVRTRGVLQGEDQHGMGSAILAAGAYNNEGTMGVAHGAGILAIRADNVPACGGACDFRSKEIAAAIDYAVIQNAHVINLSLVGQQPLKPVVVRALRRAAAAGVMIVVAGGNENRNSPSYPARYASYSGIAGMLVIAGHHDDRGRRPNQANAAGSCVDYFLRAPGTSSSSAAAYVSGALALLREAYPDLPSTQLIAALLAGARDAGRPGPDRSYGQGLLDIAGALQVLAKSAAAQ